MTTSARKTLDHPDCKAARENLAEFADMLAFNAHLKASSYLPADTDLSESEQKQLQDQIYDMLTLPPRGEGPAAFWRVFAAHHLADVAASIRNFSPATQKHALGVALSILCLLPDPSREAISYYRKFLRNAAVTKDIPTIIARAFVEGTPRMRPVDGGMHCSLIIDTLYWCDSALGNDGKASVDADVRASLAAALDSMLEPPSRAAALRLPDLFEMQRLRRVLKEVEAMPGSYYLDVMRGLLEVPLNICSGSMCKRAPEHSCSKCKTARYCGQQCQTWHWKNGHNPRCFKTDY